MKERLDKQISYKDMGEHHIFDSEDDFATRHEKKDVNIGSSRLPQSQE